MAPPSPSPDYPPRPAPRHISKSIASLAGPPEPRPPARREEQPGPAIPAPDYEALGARNLKAVTTNTLGTIRS